MRIYKALPGLVRPYKASEGLIRRYKTPYSYKFAIDLLGVVPHKELLAFDWLIWLEMAFKKVAPTEVLKGWMRPSRNIQGPY